MTKAEQTFEKLAYTPLDLEKKATLKYLVKKAEETTQPGVKKPRRKAVIIKGNPKYVDAPEYKDLATSFYNELSSKLEALGYDATFDPGKPYTQPEPADLWVGHSRGIDRLRFAPKGVKTLRVDDFLPDGHVTEDLRPTKSHWKSTPKLEAALSKLVSVGSAASK